MEKAQETSSDSDMHNTCMCACAVAVLHEQWMCLGGMQRNTHITGNNLIPISISIHFVDGSLIGVFSSGV